MRKVALLATTAMAVSGTGIAYAAVIDKTQTMSAKTSTASGSKKKPKKVTLTVSVGTKATNQAESGTFATTNAEVFFDKNLRFNPSKFPTCTPTKVVAGTCASATKVGTGSAAAEVGAGGNVAPTFKITAYNGAGGKLIMALKGQGAFNDLEKILTGTLKNASGAYGKKLVVPIPLDVQQAVPGLKTTITKFEVKINATYKRKNYVESIGCKSKKYKYAGTFKFDDGDVKKVTATSKCK